MALSGSLAHADVDLRRIRKDVYEFTRAKEWFVVKQKQYVRRIVDEARGILTNEIAERVYAIPPTSGYIRTQRLWQGVRTREFSKGTAAGEIFIDPNILSKNDYWYPVSVEFGLTTAPRYWGRRYWEHGFPKVRAMFDAEIHKMFGEVKEQLGH